MKTLTSEAPPKKQMAYLLMVVLLLIPMLFSLNFATNANATDLSNTVYDSSVQNLHELPVPNSNTNNASKGILHSVFGSLMDPVDEKNTSTTDYINQKFSFLNGNFDMQRYFNSRIAKVLTLLSFVYAIAVIYYFFMLIIGACGLLLSIFSRRLPELLLKTMLTSLAAGYVLFGLVPLIKTITWLVKS